MKCEDIKKYLTDYVSGQLDSDTEKNINDHISSCENCAQELDRMRAAVEALDRLPEQEPSPALRSRFYAMLHEEKAEARAGAKVHDRIPIRERLEGALNLLWPRRPAVQFAFSAAFLVLGIVIGISIQSGMHRNGEMTALRQEILDMRQTVSMSLMNQSSPSERIKGVSFTAEVDQPNASLLTALMKTVNNDPNVNVRLAAVDALFLFVDEPGIREALVESLAKQTSPLVQIAIIDLLVQVKERRALAALRRLVGDVEVDRTVRMHAESRMKELI